MDQEFPIEQQQPDEPVSSLNPVEILLFGVARFYPWILFLGAIGACVGLLYSLKLPNQYGSQGKFLVRLGERERQTPEAAVGIASDPRGVPTNVDVIQILKNRDVYERLAKQIGPERLLEPFDPTAFDDGGVPAMTRWLHQKQKEWFFKPRAEPVDPESPLALEAATRRAMSASSIRADATSRVVNVGFRATSPRLAQDAAHALMRLCQERHREVFSKMLQESFISEQLENARASENAVELKWAEHTRECGFHEIDKDKLQILAELGRLDEDEKEAVHQIEVHAAEIAAIELELGLIPEKVEVQRPPTEAPNPELERLQKKIDEAQRRLESLAETFKPDSVPYQKGKEKIDEQLARFAAEMVLAPKTVITDPGGPQQVDNPPYVALKEKRTEIVGKKKDLETKLGVHRSGSALERTRLDTRLAAARLCEPVHEEMQEERRQATALARQLTSAHDDAQRLGLLDVSDEMSNLVVIQEPRFEGSKVGPQRLKLVLQGLGIGAGIGFAFCLLRQLLDPKLRYPRSVERTLGVKVLGVIPETKSWRRAGRKVKRRLAV